MEFYNFMKSVLNKIDQHVKLEPLDNDRLIKLCGLLDKNIRQIEKYFDVESRTEVILLKFLEKIRM